MEKKLHIGKSTAYQSKNDKGGIIFFYYFNKKTRTKIGNIVDGASLAIAGEDK